jgi:RNA polymerase sigma-70 factor (ECF subfamily)
LDATQLSLLVQAGSGSADAWSRLDGLYRPFVWSWFRAQGVPHVDADDLTQDVLAVLAGELPHFVHSGRTGAFRTWLRGVCVHRLQGHRRRQQVQIPAVGGTDFQDQLNGVADEKLTADWDREHERHLLRQLFEGLSAHFEEKTLQAFRRLAFDGVPAAEVARELDMPVAAVYVAKSRVLSRLRAEAAGLIDDPSV